MYKYRIIKLNFPKNPKKNTTRKALKKFNNFITMKRKKEKEEKKQSKNSLWHWETACVESTKSKLVCQRAFSLWQ